MPDHANRAMDRRRNGPSRDLVAARPVGPAVRAGEDPYADLYDDLPLSCFTLSADDSILSVNAIGASLLGRDKRGLLGRSVLALLDKGERTAARRHLNAARKTGTPSRWEFRQASRSGELVWLEAFARSMPAGHGPSEILLVCKDVTVRREAQRQVREYQKQVRELTLNSFLAEEDERRRIAAGLHDDVGQNLATARMLLEGLAGAKSDEERIRRAEAIRGLIDQALATTRSLTFDLSTPILHELGLEPALGALAEQVTRDGEIRFSFTSDRKPRELPLHVCVILFRITRELAHNVVKHAGAGTARITMATFGDELHIGVEDDGVGMGDAGTAGAVKKAGFGLFSVRELLGSIGGRLEIQDKPGAGARMVAVAPLDRRGEA